MTAAGWAGWVLRRVVDLALVVALAAFAGLVVGPHVLGYRTVTMLTSSMAPGIEPGDVAVVTPLPVADVAPGMVITYHIPVGDHRVVSHRVLSADVAPDGSVTMRTRGDANDADDPWTATLAAGDTAWQVRVVVPWIGHAIQVLRTPVLSTALVVGVPVLLAAWVLVGVWRPEPADDGAGDEAGDQAGDQAQDDPGAEARDEARDEAQDVVGERV